MALANGFDDSDLKAAGFAGVALLLAQIALASPARAADAKPCAAAVREALKRESEPASPVAEATVPDEDLGEAFLPLEVKRDPARLRRFVSRANAYVPGLKWDLRTGEAEADLTYFGRRLIPWLRFVGKAPDEVVLLVDGDREIEVPLELFKDPAAIVKYPYFIGHHYHQTDLHVILRRKGPDGKPRTLFTSGWQMLPDEHFARVDPSSTAAEPTAAEGLPLDLMERTGREAGVDAVSLASRGLKGLYQVAVNPLSGSATSRELLARFQDHGAQLKFEKIQGTDGELTGWKVTDPIQGDTFVASPDDVIAVGNAGFSPHLFQWDGHFWALGEVPDNPAGAKDWLKFVILVQKMNGTGGLPREVRSWNMKGLQLPREVKLDARGNPVEVANTQYPNPPLWGLVARELYRVDPEGMRAMLPEVIRSLEWHRAWWRDQLGVDAAGRDLKPGRKLLGFKWSNLGSGRDNAPRCLDREGCLALDAITYYKMMLDQEEELCRALGLRDKADAARRQAREVARTINRYYWNDKLGMYSDIIAHPGGRIEHSNIRTMVGFWPMMARVPGPTRVRRLVDGNLLNPEQFGGVPMPYSVARSHAGQVDEEGRPLFDLAGSYWRGGPWVGPDGRMTTEGLFANGLRAEAARQHENYMGGLTQASRYARLGDTPARLNGIPLTDERLAEMKKKRLWFWESFGYQPESELLAAIGSVNPRAEPEAARIPQAPGFAPGNQGLRMTFNHERIGGGASWHDTRDGLAWTDQIAKEGIKIEFGKYETPPDYGPETLEESARRVAELLKIPLYRDQFFAEIPSLRPIAKRLHRMTERECAAEILRRAKGSDAFAEQMRRIRDGYVELSPAFDPGERVSYLKNQSYRGTRYDLQVDQLGDNEVRITVREPQGSFHPLPFQFNRLWKRTSQGTVVTDRPVASSEVILIGDGGPGQKRATMPDGSVAWRATIPLSRD